MSQAVATAAPTLADIEAAANRAETRSDAIDMAIQALGQGSEDLLVLRLVAEGFEHDGRLVDAAALAHRATVVAPDQAAVWTEFSRLLLQLGRREEAVEAARTALERDPGAYAVQSNAAAVFLSLNDFARAAAHAQKAAGIRPTAPEPLSTLAIICARTSDFPRAREFAERALALRPDLPGAEIALARVELAEDRSGLAIDRLQKVLGYPILVEGHRAEALTTLGDALDAAGQADRAFASYAAGNAVMARRATAAVDGGGRRAIDHARSMEIYFDATDPAAWREGAGDDRVGREAVGHVFLVGFPRSGTTLLENALARHPAVLALEETDALALCAGDLMADGEALGRLARLKAPDADACRAIYWRRAAELLGSPLGGKIVVDKLPIGTVALPVISKLFPNARMLFARRDPRDVVLSCFRRLFGINEVMAEFLTLESAARYYDQVMRLAVLYEAKLPLAIHHIRHEDVVADFDGELSKALGFIGLAWDPAVRDFADRAMRARTPSATQLAVGLNARGVGAWKRFAAQMAPVLPILEPWVARFGYEPTDPALLPAPPDPGFAPAREGIGKALAAGDWAGAFTKVEEAFARGFSDPLLYRLRAVRAQQEGRPADAVVDFQRALEEAPGDVALLSALGLCLARSGRAVEALARLNEAIALSPAFAPAHFNRGWSLEGLGDLAGARAAYVRAVEHDPRHAQALGALAALAARSAAWDEARRLAEQALALASSLPSAALALAQAEAAQGDASRAEERLRALIASSQAGPHEKAVAQRALGDVLDQLGRPAEAFAAYQAGAAGVLALHGPRFEASGAERTSHIVERLRAYFGAADPAPWRTSPAADGEATPIFVVGFPRSGTTLTAQALALHPALFTLDEVDTLADAIAAVFADEAAPSRLASIDEKEAATFRDLYRRRARAAGWPDNGPRLVDKAPMNTLALPIIAKLFPGAKILFLRRDPRDVVLSCFRRPLAINPTTIDFLSLDGAARLYDQTMRLFETYRAILPLDLRIQSYEALARDFDAEGRAICAFLDLVWSEAMAGFSSRAAEVATPSAAQLAGGLTAEGVGAWRRYRDALAPVLPILAPWAERFGYPAD
ncbi:MAG: sulfotransferase [Caulobacteraceae bacterium]